jgi:diphthamide synthase (EF-2-diphthine--ammonia ligase)
MRAACDEATAGGVQAIAFGDLFLEDIRRYREQSLEGTALTPVFPVWKLDTRKLPRAMIEAGVKTRIVCVDPTKLSREFAGRDLDEQFLRDLPEGVDPCGENGEFHTCVYDGPMFRHPIPVESGEVVERDGFIFADIKVKR